MLQIISLTEVGHSGHAIVGPGGTVIVDPPLTVSITIEAVAGLDVVGVIDTEPAVWRISGARLVASHLGVPHWAVGDGHGVGAVRFEDHLPPGFGVENIGGRPIVTINGATALIGSQDRHGSRHALDALAARWPLGQFIGSAGEHTANELSGLVTAPPSPLNQEAVVLTNRGDVDMHWADPRFVTEVREVTSDHLTRRAGSAFAATIVRLDAHTESHTGHNDGAIHIAPERLASVVPTLMGHRELVVSAADPALAEQAAGFLARLGLTPVSWVRQE
jgi:hypothetical protein